MLKIASGRWSVEREIGSQLPVTFPECMCSWEHMDVQACTQLTHLHRVSQKAEEWREGTRRVRVTASTLLDQGREEPGTRLHVALG